MLPKVSIIIPTYNRGSIIGETLDSILVQTYMHWECIVVDDGSTDDTKDVLKTYIERDSRFKYVIRPDYMPKGPSACRNLGFKKSNGIYINFFDSDDLLESNAYEKAIKEFDRDTDAVIMNSALTEMDSGQFIRKNNVYSSNLLTDYFVGNITFFVGGPVWKRSFLDKQVMLFDESIRNIDDWDFNLRMLYEKPNLKFLLNVSIYYRIHKNSLSKEVWKLNRKEIVSEFRTRDKHLKLVKGKENVDYPLIKDFILKRYRRYLIRSMKKNPSLTPLLIRKLIRQALHFGDIITALKSTLGFLLYKLSGKGYAFFK
ncbi:glycosyltransferase family 2 protein [Aegicerativicinus sediminis]|uniref:glycosyltransferase family 2 protein n=1 Tax=Aegicerativicinus sediminis TaxID=2893202 RepID=UPI001E33E8D5|nr:glycosyltransferase [Aegicerativicinus sediminis]